jgi:hypothetical protein
VNPPIATVRTAYPRRGHNTFGRCYRILMYTIPRSLLFCT